MRAVSLLVSFLCAEAVLSPSKLSIHSNGLDSTIMNWVRTAKPRLVKILDPSRGDDVQIKQASPDTVIVGRIYQQDQPTSGDPAQAAQAWWQACKDTISSLPQVDYWEGYNEPDVGSVQSVNWLAAFDVARVSILAGAGFKASVGQFSVGNPDVNNKALIEAFYPAIDAALKAKGALALHEYSSPLMSSCYTGNVSSGEGWTTGRYRKLYNNYLKPTGRGSIPLLITEGGIDAACGPPSLSGWQKACGSVWDGLNVPPKGDCVDQYMGQLAWYDQVMRSDPFVIGMTLFCYHCFGFDSFEVEPIIPALTKYMTPNSTIGE